MKNMLWRPAFVVASVTVVLASGCPRPRVSPSRAQERTGPPRSQPKPEWGIVLDREGAGLLWVSADDPSVQRTLASGVSDAEHGVVALSPDRRRVAFVSEEGALEVADLVGGETLRLAEPLGADAAGERSDLSWAPDSSRLAYVEAGDIRIASPGTDTLQLTHSGDVIGLGWSPNGQQIAYGSHDPKTYSDRGLWVMSAAGGESQRIAPPTGDVFSATGPVWSPDGSVIAFVHAWEGGVLAFVTPDGRRKQTRITAAGGRLEWLPDSSAVLCTDRFYEDDPTGLFRCPAFGKPEKLVEGRVEAFALSPDGHLMVGVAQGDLMSDDRTATIRILSWPGLTEEWSAELPPSPLWCEWRPDGGELGLEQYSAHGKRAAYVVTPGQEPRPMAEDIGWVYGWGRVDPAPGP